MTLVIQYLQAKQVGKYHIRCRICQTLPRLQHQVRLGPPWACQDRLDNHYIIQRKIMMSVILWFLGVSMMEEKQGRLSQLWVAAGAKNDELVNGGYYMTIGRYSDDRLDKTAKSLKLAEDLWVSTQDVLAKV
jgi:hypothetical protein